MMELPKFPKPREFPDFELKYEDVVTISEINGKKLLYARCRMNEPKFDYASVADCDIVAVINRGGVLREEVIGKFYIWDDNKYVVYLPKYVYYYSGFEGGKPYDNPNPALAKYFVVEHVG